MSNDSKLWLARGLVLLSFILNSWFLGQLTKEAIKSFSSNAHPRLGLWFALFLIATLLNIPIYIYYRRAKGKRWNPTDHTSQTQIDVETLAAYAKLEQQSKEAQKTERKTPLT
jgi:hypothetical protein